MRTLFTTLIFISLLFGSAGELCAQSSGQALGEQPLGVNDGKKIPKAAEGIGVDEKIGDQLELDLIFDNEKDIQISLGDYFDGKRPVMLSFNYSGCPKLCSVQLENMVTTLNDVDMKIGPDFQMISISVDPNEQASRAKKAKELFMKYYNSKHRERSREGWHFLTGDLDEIEFATDNCGFRYKYIPHQKLFSHPPVYILLSPQGKIVRYIHGLDYDPKVIQQALVDAKAGKSGEAINKESYGFLGCFLFDESTGKYTMQIMGIMRLGGAVTVLLLIGSLVPFWFFRRGKNADDADNDSNENSEVDSFDKTAPSTA